MYQRRWYVPEPHCCAVLSVKVRHVVWASQRCIVFPSNCCTDKEVDWWAAIKPSGDNGYVYMDSTTNGFKLSSHTVDGVAAFSGSVTKTMEALVTSSDNIVYNDQPGDATRKRGHAKGGMTRGFWLVHTVPNYPAVERRKRWTLDRRREKFSYYPGSGALMDLRGCQRVFSVCSCSGRRQP
jgi:hypothetical protein